MPELPEVETVRRGLAPAFEGARILEVTLRRPDLRFPLPPDMRRRLVNQDVVALLRRAKYLQIRLASGDVLVAHLGMTGRFTISAPEGSKAQPGAFVRNAGGCDKHDHVILSLSNGFQVTYNDARRFGFMLLVPEAELAAHPLFAALGPEPLGNELDAQHLADRGAGRKADLKAFLMDQRNVAGLGNIYVCEALFRAGLSPKRAAACLARAGGRPSQAAERLVTAIRTVLTAAIEAGGSTLRDYRAADGALGYFQHQHQVYDREGEPCVTEGCGGRIRRLVQNGRSTFYCPRCQR